MIPLGVRLANFLGTVEFVADEQIQRAVWIDKRSGVTSITSIGELYAQFFDDNDMDGFIIEELSTTPLSTTQKTAIVRFRDALNAVERLPSYRDNDDKQTLETAEWNVLVQCAKDTLAAFAASEMPSASSHVREA